MPADGSHTTSTSTPTNAVARPGWCVTGTLTALAVTLATLSSPAPAEAATATYWRTTRCGNAGTVSVTWQRNGAYLRPSATRFDSSPAVTYLYAYHVAAGRTRASAAYWEAGRHIYTHNLAFGWAPASAGQRVTIRLVGPARVICEASVRS